MTKHYELYEIHTVTIENGHDYEGELPKKVDNKTWVESNSEIVGTAKDIVKHLLKYELKNYKLVKRMRKVSHKPKPRVLEFKKDDG